MKGKKGSLFSSSKRGSIVIDSIFVVVILLILAFSWIFPNMILDDINDDLQEDEDLRTDTKEGLKDNTESMSGSGDGSFIVAFILFWAMLLIASYNSDTHPIFFVFSIILMVFALVVVGIVGNAYEEVVTEEGPDEMVPLYPMTHWIMTHLLIVATVIIISVAIVLYGKPR